MSRFWAVIALSTLCLLSVAGVSWAQDSISVSTSPTTDTITRDDISGASARANHPYIESIDPVSSITVAVTQTASWYVQATVSVDGWPSVADEPSTEILEMCDQDTGCDEDTDWHKTGEQIRSGSCASPPCAINFDVEYRLNLGLFDDGASNDYGDYDFGVTFELYVDNILADSDSSTTITIDADAVVYIEVYEQPTVSDPTIDRAGGDLQNRYFNLADFSVRIWAISDYNVAASVIILDGGGSGDYDPNGLLEINVDHFDDDSEEDCMVNLWGWQEVKVYPAVSDPVFTGCNTLDHIYGTYRDYSTAFLTIRMDLDNLGDNASGTNFQFQIVMTITET